MSNEIIVRTDVINPHTYLDIELEYKDLVHSIDKCGGYALFQQIYKYYEGKSKGYRYIKKMEELLIVGSEQFNNNKYVYLKITALKYLEFKKTGLVNSSPVRRHTKKPSFRPLMNSVYSFEYLLNKKEWITTERSIEVLEKFIGKMRSILQINRIQNIHLVKVEKDDYVEKLQTKLKILGDRNGIYLKDYQENTELRNSNLKFIWFDFDQNIGENTVLRALILISRFLNKVGTKRKLNCCKFSLEIVTIGTERKEVLENLTERALQHIEKKNSYYLKKSIDTKENQVVSTIESITYNSFPDIEGYIKLSSKGNDEFSFVNVDTVDRLENLKNVLNETKK